MIWEYDGHGYDTQGDYQAALKYKLDNLASWVFDYMDTSLPSDERGNSEMVFLGILGYAGLVLDDSEYINFVDYWLAEKIDDEFQEGSGIYKEGLHYQSFAYIFLSNYFTARKRYHDPGTLDHGYLNYYDDINISKMFEEGMYLLYPDMSFVPFDDCWKINYGSGIELHPDILNYYLYPPYGMIEYYYQQDYANPEILDLIRFYINERQESDDSIEYPVMIFGGMKLPIILSFEENHVDIYGDSSIPATIQESNYSNEEFTVLRNGLESEIDFRENLAVFVNHENYESYKIWHEHADQTSFSLYYK